MKRNSLLYFETPDAFNSFVTSLDIYKGWKITSGSMNDRGKVIEDKCYTKKLRMIFKDKDFFRKKVSLAEVVSWLDNLILIQRLLSRLKLKLSKDKYNDISISVEYMINMSKKMRIDYLILYNDNILLLELRMVNSFVKIRSTWENKFRELLIYKELMSYYIFNKEFILFALIPLYEFEGNKKVPKNINYNNNQLDFLAEYILEYLI